MRILVCGGRDFNDRRRVFEVLDAVDRKRGIDCIIHGAARGADRLAGEWARERRRSEEAYPANWPAHRKKAGMIRNWVMLHKARPDAVVAFPGGRGTADVVRRVKAAGLPVWEVPAACPV